jgi:hypothetical protein
MQHNPRQEIETARQLSKVRTQPHLGILERCKYLCERGGTLLVPTSSDPFLKPPLDRVLKEKNIQHRLHHHQQNIAADPIGINAVPTSR